MFDVISNLIKDMEKDPSSFKVCESRYVNQSIIFRVEKDDSLKQMIQNKILSDPSPSEKASFPRLLAASGGLSTKIQEWCLEEICRQNSGDIVPEIGVDLVESKLTSVSNSLLSILEPLDHSSN